MMPYVLGFFGRHEVVAVGVLAHLLDRLAGVLGEDLVEALAQVDAPRARGSRCRPPGPRSRPTSWWIRIAALGSAKRLPLAPPASSRAPMLMALPTQMVLHVGLDELHGVVDGQAGVHRAAGAVDVEADVLVGVVGLEVDELGDDEVGDLVVDRRAEEDDPLVEQARVDVEGALAAARLLDDHRNQWHSRLHPSLQGYDRLCHSSLCRDTQASGGAPASATSSTTSSSDLGSGFLGLDRLGGQLVGLRPLYLRRPARRGSRPSWPLPIRRAPALAFRTCGDRRGACR